MLRGTIRRGRILLLTLSVGAMPLALESCDQNVRDVVLGGVQAAANGLAGTFIDAYFASLQPKQENATTL